MIANYDLIVFDWDGTLANSIDWIVDCIITVAEKQHLLVPSEQACKDIIGLSLPNAMLELFPGLSEAEKGRMVAEYKILYLAKPITPNDLFLDALPVLNELQRMGKTLAVATGKGQLGLDRALDGTQIRSFFHQLRCADTMKSKPSPHMLFDIMQTTNHSPEKTIMIGDSTLDLTMANNAGVASIGVTTGAHSREVLEQHSPLACVNKLIDIFEG
ncbi:MAG: HAD-IA family hydrolase [Cycloclasticus sp.]